MGDISGKSYHDFGFSGIIVYINVKKIKKPIQTYWRNKNKTMLEFAWNALFPFNLSTIAHFYKKVKRFVKKQILERMKGIEPSYSAWEAAVLPLYYIRIVFHGSTFAIKSQGFYMIFTHKMICFVLTLLKK